MLYILAIRDITVCWLEHLHESIRPFTLGRRLSTPHMRPIRLASHISVGIMPEQTPASGKHTVALNILDIAE